MRTLYLLFVLGTVITGSVKAADPHEIVGWGKNNKGQLDIPSGQFQVIAAGLRHSLGVTLDGEIMGWGENNRGQINIPSGQFQDRAWVKAQEQTSSSGNGQGGHHPGHLADFLVSRWLLFKVGFVHNRAEVSCAQEGAEKDYP